MIDETIEEIREMQTHSSSAVAIKAARALGELADREFATVEEFRRSLDRNASALRRANPSHASLQNATHEVVDAVEAADPDTVEGAQSATREAIEDVVDRIEHGKRRAAERAAERLDDGATLLTHDYSSTVLEAIDVAVADGKRFTVYVSEARPRYLGRKTARTLASYDPVDVNLIVDSAWGTVLPRVDEVYVGMDSIVDGTLYNRVGTFPLAATAEEVGVPVYVVGSEAKVIDGGFVFENDFRSPSEVMREPAEGFEIENPAYDATPTGLLAAAITDQGVKEF
ncbi:initiation factor 2B [Halobacteriales archaeon QS_1_68_20]|nr:MAG: initiation factor 2B [Halobacteriales archaeon QS_1_68_20]